MVDVQDPFEGGLSVLDRTYEDILQVVENLPVIDTHEHLQWTVYDSSRELEWVSKTAKS